MAGMNEEEDYLHQLLQNAMMQDAGFEEEDNQTDDVSEESESEQEIMPDEEPEEDFLFEPDEEMQDTEQEESDVLDFDTDIFSEPEEEAEDFPADDNSDMLVLEEEFASENASEAMPEETENASDDEIFSLDELMSGVKDESTVSEEMPEEDEDWEPDGLESDYLNDLKDIVESDSNQSDFDVLEDFGQDSEDSDSEMPKAAEVKDFSDGYEEPEENGGLEDILALDEESPLSDAVSESMEEPLADEEPEHIFLSEEEDNADASGDRDEIEIEDELEAEESGGDTKKSKSKNKAKKEKKQKKEKSEKKFSLKSFFMDYDEEDSESKTADANQQLIDELYEGKSSLDDADPNDIDGSVKKKKEKKVKEKKEKPKKEPKPKKVKAPKENTQKGGFNVGLLFKAILIAAVLVAAIIFGSSFFTYRNTVKSAQEYFDSGKYPEAYSRLSGLKIKSKDNDLYMKARTVMAVYQGIESYENYIALDDVPHALDALIMAVGRKNRNEENAIKYEVTGEVNTIYNRIIGMLDRYGISEAQALDYFTMKDYDEYFAILESIGGHGVDSNN